MNSFRLAIEVKEYHRMTLTNKLRADYAELINHTLDAIPFEELTDFEFVQSALANILTPNIAYQVPIKYQERIMAISDYLTSPELYVRKAENYAEYRDIIAAQNS